MGSRIIGVLVALSISGSVAWASTTGPPTGSHHPPKGGHGHGYGGKVTICHKRGHKWDHWKWDKHDRFVTIRVSERAVWRHLRHGDKLGPCRR